MTQNRRGEDNNINSNTVAFFYFIEVLKYFSLYNSYHMVKFIYIKSLVNSEKCFNSSAK